jgi:hypothetical protein
MNPAEAAIRDAIDRAPDDPRGYRALVELLWDTGRHSDLGTIGESPATAGLGSGACLPTLTHGVLLLDDVLPPLTLAQLDSVWQPTETILPTVQTTDASRVGLDVDTVTRNVRGADLSHVAGLINGTIRRILEDHAAPAFGLVAEYWEWPLGLHYDGGGLYHPHADSENPDGAGGWTKVVNRDLSILIYLDDDFVGGELVFVAQALQFRPRAGSAIVFPSDHRFVHGVQPVQRGQRRVISSWAKAEQTPHIRPPLAERVPREAFPRR